MPRPVALLPRPSTSRYDEVPPTLAVVGDEGCYRGVLDRSLAVAANAGAPLQVVVLHQRIRLTTDPALLGYVNRRLQQRLQILRAELDGHPGGGPATVQVLTHGGSPLRSSLTSAWRAVDAFAETIGARVVVLPWELSEMAWTRNAGSGRVLVAVPDEADRPLPAGRW